MDARLRSYELQTMPGEVQIRSNLCGEGTGGVRESRAMKARMDLLVGLTACSAEMSNNYSFKPIGYEITDPSK